MEEVRQEEKTAQPIFMLASSNLGDEILPSVSRGKHRRRVLAGKTVALPPLFHLRPPLSRFPCAGRRRHHLPRLRDAAFIPGITSSSPEARRSGLLVGVQYLPASGRLLYVAAAPLFRRNTVARAGLSILIVADVPSAARSSSPARRLAVPPPSSDSQRRVPRRPRLRAAAAGCPRRLLAGPGRRRRRPPVVPGRRGVRPSVKPFSSVVRVRQVCRCSPVVVFVLDSASSRLVPAASRLRPRIAAEVVPSPFVPVVPGRLRRARSSLSFPRLVAWWIPPPRCPVLVLSVSPVPVVRLSAPVPVYRCRQSFACARGDRACSFACVLRVASVVPEVPEAWFVVVAKGSEGRSL
uniref:Cell wall protein-like n=1 Tax=Oryza sativa subsp. japonica TaxID=39947 RepID=Q65WS3_ORYSJ|nr:hypothetical protein [Oryza sativa Japonica Group]